MVRVASSLGKTICSNARANTSSASMTNSRLMSCPPPAAHKYEELASHIEERELDGIRVPILSLAGLLLTKEGMREGPRRPAGSLKKRLPF